MLTPIRAKPRTIVVIWRDADGAEWREMRRVHFERGFGHFVRWNKHFVLVEPLQTELRIDIPGPVARCPVASTSRAPS